MFGRAHDDVVKQLDFHELSRSRHVARYPDVGFAGRWVAAGMVMLCEAPVYVE